MRVKVYEDPQTRRRPEGDATIVRLHCGSHADGAVFVWVRFDDDEFRDAHLRKVYPGDVIMPEDQLVAEFEAFMRRR